MNWKQTKPYKSILEVVMDKSGMTKEELINPLPVHATKIENLVNAAEMIKQYIENGKSIYIVGDYDADGITSSAILYHLFSQLGNTPIVRLPKRMSEGYGIREKTIEDFAPSLLITVDNGISSINPIKVAKNRGFDVVILDHHIPQDILPPADVIVDPHINPEKNGYVEYCGAGLAYKLAQLLTTDKYLLAKLESLAAIGTIADSMPLNGDNRYIVKNGLQTIRDGNCIFPGLKALLDIAEVYNINETDVGFKVGPMLNAAGRVIDDGATLSLKTLIASNYVEGENLAKELKTLNEKRKDMTNEVEDYIEGIISAEGLQYDAPLCVYAEDLPEGIIGIIAGRLASKYKTPTFVLSNCSISGLYKGSGRTYGNYNLLSVINKARPFIATAGGHEGAAGISVTEDNYINMVNTMYQFMADYEPPVIDTEEYDISITAFDISSCYEELQKYAPYGQGNPRPIIKVENVMLLPRGGHTFRPMGKNYEHIKLYGKNFSVVCFDKAQEFKSMGCPTNIDVIGTISQNTFKYNSELQIEAVDFKERSIPHKRPSTLLEALRLNGTI